MNEQVSSVSEPNPDMDKLKVIQLESTSRCNAKCVMCPHGANTLGTRAPYFDDALFHRILAEAVDLQVETITPFLTGEFFVFPRWRQWMLAIRNAGFRTFIYTNGALLNQQALDFLKAFPNIKQLVISHHAVTQETEFAVTGLPFTRIEANVKAALDADLPFPVELHFVENDLNKHEAEAFVEKWGSAAKVIPFFTYGGKIRADVEDFSHPQQPCTRLLNEMTVLSSGVVSLCCLDGSGDVILGDLHSEKIWDVWVRAKHLRDRHRRFDFDMPLCRDCNMNRLPKGFTSKL